MSTSTLNYPTVQLVSTLRPAATNGAPSSSDWNNSFKEALADLASLANVWNSQILPLVNAIPETATSLGLQGSTIIADSSDQTPVFYDSTSSQANTIADALRVVSSSQNDLSTSIASLSTRVTQLASRVAATNQNDVAQALQNFSTQLNSILAQLKVVQAAQTALRLPTTDGEPTDTQADGAIRYDATSSTIWVATDGGWAQHASVALPLSIINNLSNTTANSVVDFSIANNSTASGIVHYSIHADDGIDFQVISGQLIFAAANKAGTVTVNSALLDTASAVSSGTLAPGWIVNSPVANTARVAVIPSSSLTPTTLSIKFSVENLGVGDSEITLY